MPAGFLQVSQHTCMCCCSSNAEQEGHEMLTERRMALRFLPG